MAYTIGVDYFNAFWLKKAVKNGDGDLPSWPGLPWDPAGYAGTVARFPWNGSIPEAGEFGEGAQYSPHWYVEEARIKGGYNNTNVDYGVRAYLTRDYKFADNLRSPLEIPNGLIYSGVLNSKMSVNMTNQFSTGEPITRRADPHNGSIQKLYSEDSNLLVFQENKVNRALIDKDTIYAAEGGTQTQAAGTVIGQLVPYLGDYGISRNPESFAVYGYRKYFADKDRGVILRLSRDGITEISTYGMFDYFRDYLATLTDEWQPVRSNVYLRDAVTPIWVPGTTALNPHGAGRGINIVNGDLCSVPLGSTIEGFIGANPTPLPILNIWGNPLVVVATAPPNGALVPAGSVGILTSGNILSWLVLNPTVDRFRFTTWTKSHIPGGWDIHQRNYVLSMQRDRFFAPIAGQSPYNTLAFEEAINGWVSSHTYKPNFVGSLKNKYYSFDNAGLYEHYDDTNPNNRGTYYGLTSESNITFIFNPNPSAEKNFQTINYEGSNGWEVDSFISDFTEPNQDPYPITPVTFPITTSAAWQEDSDTTAAILSYEGGKYIDPSDNVTYHVGFNRKENKYCANLINNSTEHAGEVVWGDSMTGIKGYYATIVMSTDNTTDIGGMKELYAVSSKYVLSSY